MKKLLPTRAVWWCMTAAGLLAICGCSKQSLKAELVSRIHVPPKAAGSPAAAPTPPRAPEVPPQPPVVKPKSPPKPAAKLAPKQHRFAPIFKGTAAAKAFREKRWADAAKLYKRWLKQHPASRLAPRAQLLRHVSLLYSGNSTAAAVGLEALINDRDELVDYVRLLAADARLRQGLAGRTIKHLNAIGSKHFAQRRRAARLRARAYVVLGRNDKAAQRYLQFVKDYPQAGSTELLEAASALAKATKPKHADQARVLRTVIARYPFTQSSRIAAARLKRLPKALHRPQLSEAMLRLEALYRAKRHRHTTVAARDIQRRARRGGRSWCRAGYLMARTLERMRKARKSLPVYGELVKHCRKTDRSLFLNILYYAAKRQMNSGHSRSALNWFAEFRKLAPNHRYVDDSMRWEAKLLKRLGKHKQAANKLDQVISHPTGDMAEDAAWDLFWHQYEAGRFKRAVQIAQSATNRIGWESKSYTSGRLAYWLGRAYERRGKKISAALAYAQCIRDYPLTYYALLAGKRLTRLDSEAAARAMADAKKEVAGRSILQANTKQLNAPGFKRAVALLRLGLHSYARAELSRLRLSGRSDADRDWLWALLMHESGDYTRAHNIGRRRRLDYARHYPVGNHRERWLLTYPRPKPFARTVKEAAKKHRIEPAYVWAIMRTESAFRKDAVSFANAYGLMQLILPTGRAMARRARVKGKVDRQRLMDPDLNIRLGTRFLGRLARRFNNNLALVAAGYNAGPGGPMKWMRRWPNVELDQFVERIPYRETRRYVKAVITSYLRYRALYGKTSMPKLSLRLPSME